MTSNALLSTLHDATLHSVQLDWASGDVRFELSAAVEDGGGVSRVVLHAREVSLLHCPRQLKWGPSASLYQVRSSLSLKGVLRLEVEVQSGDIIEVEARDIAVEVVPT
jgi:hypothetical protein